MRFAKHEWWLPKIFCLIAACALWVYVMNEQNPMVENTYTVPVEVRNLDRSLVATNVPLKVKAKIRMPRSDMVYMRSDNIKAYVDLSGLTDGDFPNTKIHISVPGDESVISVTPEYFDLNIDTYAVKTLPAVIEVFGTPDANFSVESRKRHRTRSRSREALPRSQRRIAPWSLSMYPARTRTLWNLTV